MEYLQKKQKDYSLEKKNLMAKLKEKCRENDKLKLDLSSKNIRIQHLEQMVEKGKELFQVVNMKQMELSQEMSLTKRELDTKKNELIQQITRGVIIQNEVHILKGKYASLREATNDLKDTKVIQDKHQA